MLTRRKIGEVGRDRLLGAVAAANAAGGPTYEKAMLFLCPGQGGETGGAGLRPEFDRFYVGRRDPSDYGIFGGG